MRKSAYGGNLDGNPLSYYDRTWLIDAPEDIKEYKDRERFESVVGTLIDVAKNIKNPNKITIDDVPVHTITLSKEEYGEGDTMDSAEWVNRVNKAVKGYDLDAIKDLSSYGYIHYNATPQAAPSRARSSQEASDGNPSWLGWAGAGAGLAALAGVGYLLKKANTVTEDLIPDGTTLWDIEEKDINKAKKKYAGHPKFERLMSLLRQLDELNKAETKSLEDEQKARATFIKARTELDKQRELQMKPAATALDNAWGNVYRVLASGGSPSADTHRAYVNARKAYTDESKKWDKQYADIDNQMGQALRPYTQHQGMISSDRYELMNTDI